MLLVFLMPGANGESEPNDSPSTAERIGSDGVSGSVAYNDDDYFTVTVGEDKVATFSLELILGEYVELRTVDEYGDYVYYPSVSLYSEFTGDRDTEEVENYYSDQTYIFEVSGNGSYILTAEVRDFPDYADEHSSRATAKRIGEGVYKGDVTSGDIMLGNGDDDYYLIRVPAEHVLTVKLTFDSAPEDDYYPLIMLEGLQDDSSIWDLMYLSVNDVGFSETGEYRNEGSEDVNYYLKVTGDGEYTITTELEPMENEDISEFIDNFCTGFVIFIGGGLFLVIIILIVIILIVIFNKRRK